MKSLVDVIVRDDDGVMIDDGAAVDDGAGDSILGGLDLDDDRGNAVDGLLGSVDDLLGFAVDGRLNSSTLMDGGVDGSDDLRVRLGTEAIADLGRVCGGSGNTGMGGAHINSFNTRHVPALMM